MSGFQVGPETFVTVSSEVLDAEGETAGAAEVLGFVFGRGLLFPRIEQALEGRIAGDCVSVKLDPRDAFGQRDPAAILAVAREDFPDDVAAGDRFEVENDAGGMLVVHVLDVSENEVHIDTNHPLSGQVVTMQVTILEVRVATAEEQAAAELELADTLAMAELAAQRPDPGRQPGDQEASTPLLSLQSLIRNRP